MPSDARKHWSEEDAQAFSRTVLDSGSHIGVMFLDLDGRITGWSEGCCFIVGHDARDVLGQPFSLIFTPEDRERRLHEHELRAAREVGFAEDERWHVRKDGALFWASGITLPLLADGVLRGYIKTFKDATPLRSRLSVLENEVKQSARAMADRNFFQAWIAHELRNPLAPLRAVAQVMERQDTQGSQAHLLKVLDRQLGFLERLVEDLVDLTRVEAGKLQVTYRTAELQHLLRVAVDSCRDRAQAGGVQLKTLLPAVPIAVEVDPDRMHQVVINLLTNAIKFTPSGGSVALLATADQTHFLVQVKDTGKGIEPELLPRTSTCSPRPMAQTLNAARD